MNDSRSDALETPAIHRSLLWLTTAVVGVVFFFVAHNFQVSKCERFAPWSDTESAVEAGQNVVKGLALSSVGLLGAYLALRRDGRPLRLTGWLPALMIVYLVWATASVLWSGDPGLSLRRLAVLGFCVLGAIGIARQFQPRDVALMALAISGIYLLVGVGTEVALGTFRPWLPGYRFAGTVHPNSQGVHLVVFCLAAFCLARTATQGRAWLWTLFSLGLIFLVLTKSRTSCAALAIALVALWSLSVSGRTLMLATLGAAFAISFAALTSTLFGMDVDDKLLDAVMLGRHEESELLTGRIPIWTELLNYVRKRPLQGYGYESFWTAKHIEAVSDEVQWPLREAHNAYIDALLSVGLIGVAAFVAVVLLGFRRAAIAYQHTKDPGFAFLVGALVLGMIGACLETGMASPNFTTLTIGAGVVGLLTLP